MKATRGSKFIKMNRSRRAIEKSIKRRCVEYSTIGCEVVATFIIIFGMCRREGV
jgi:hypothetical protein